MSGASRELEAVEALLAIAGAMEGTLRQSFVDRVARGLIRACAPEAFGGNAAMAATRARCWSLAAFNAAGALESVGRELSARSVTLSLLAEREADR